MLVALEAELANQGLLSQQLPSAEALASTAPFACDLMPFEQWLQFIFLPKLHYLLDEQMSLPNKIAVAPMAQHVWAEGAKHQHLIRILTDLDALLSQPE
ncbi:YqcC family protein [Shewanella schlegeliana]|uniref:YqcC family protein n=2 Tax=Shewanella schlegeliana TaxID=190308 RepID=A0ABS1SY11_9GAMM|nr:YqcC family protein [Shewanella schlegeliana]